MNRLTQLVALSILMLASTMALADRSSDRGRYYGQSNDHRSQQYGSYDRGHNDNYGNKHGNTRDNKYGNERYANRNYNRNYDRHQNRHQNRHHNRYQNRRYAQYDRYRHRHNGRSCYVRHASGYAGPYGGPVMLPIPPVVALFPPRPRLYIGGTIVF